MGKKILFVCFKRYNSILDGGGMANLRCLRMLEKCLGKQNVTAIYLHDERKKLSFLEKICSIYYFFLDYHNGLTPSWVRNVVDMASAHDYVFLSTSLFGIIARSLKNTGYQGKTFVHFHNVESEYYQSCLSHWLPGRNIIIRCAAHNDEFSCHYADSIMVLNERDKELLRKKYGRTAEIVLPIALSDKFKGADQNVMTSSLPLCTFIGSCFAPNNEGILWFVRYVLPYVNIRFKVVGKNMAKLQSAHSCLKTIEFVSDAPDLEPYFEEADFIVLPIFSGSGMKVKTCESLMYGKNILATSEAFEGYCVDTEKVGGLCNTAEEFISCINRMSNHPVKRFNTYSRQIYIEHYSEKATEQIFKNMLDL